MLEAKVFQYQGGPKPNGTGGAAYIPSDVVSEIVLFRKKGDGNLWIPDPEKYDILVGARAQNWYESRKSSLDESVVQVSESVVEWGRAVHSAQKPPEVNGYLLLPNVPSISRLRSKLVRYLVGPIIW
jgi:hypothetical protein